ncbi:exodeoxyribonuclease VII small subunit [Aliidiomarina halalkaliphila]|uniref:Exodeoxyribonuclease 7 small subunit n=1 Tax=Aliidiomarina halalkaliphila TaxID=2593535 RepID=A0A552WZ47_9GAMM|nr:exodeoxyribonuclease VII small subunit [Aliidiomarina halalkaliphila]TRW48100.1 exodeoxyribonuclease VII small subunit [Aliidiomarina halalkaliphila]
MSDKASKPEAIGFEQAIQELEQIIQALEQGDLPLEQSLQQFERAVALTRVSQKKLQDAEQRVQILLQQQQEETLSDFTDAASDEATP